MRLEDALTISASETDYDLLVLDEALNRLAAKEAQLAKVVELRFFSGLDVVETAEVPGLSESTVKRALWKDADADIPILIEAKREYEKLK